MVRADEINAGAPDDGYEPAADKNAASSVVIEADGSAVLPYYYRLIRYTLVFNIARGSGRITIGGNTWSGSGYRIEDVVLGQDISAMWPSSAEEIYDTADRKQYFRYWSGAGANYITKRYELIWQNVSSADSAHVMTYTAGWTASSQNRSAKYWLQQPDGTYAVEDAYTQTGLNTSNLGAKDISGYRIHNGSPAGYPASGYADGIYVYNFYYDRDAFTIDYYDAGTLLRAKEGILYEADISSSEYDYVPVPPAGKEDYSWGGWYADSALQTPYTFTVMPGSNVVLYAKWIPPQYTVTYRTDHDGTETIWRRTVVESGRMDTVPEEPVREGYSFTGWYTLASGGERYYPGSAPVYSDLTLYARWEAVPLRYTVKYVQKDTDKALYTEKTVENRSFHPGQRITEQAVPVAGYVPEQTSLSLSLSVNASENILIFEYVPKKERLSYTVRFVLKEDPSIRVAEDLTGEIEDSYARLTVKAAAVTDPAYRDYYPEELTKTIELGADSTSNTVYFYYVTDMVDVQTEWVDMTGTPIPGRETTRTKCRPGDSVRIDTAIPGYTLHHIKDNDSGEYFERQSHTVGTGSGRSFTVFMQKDLTIKVLDKTKVYDGTMLTAQGPDDVQAVGLMPGDVLAQVHASGGQTDAGTGYVYPDQAVITGAHDSSYYHISYEGGALTVTRRPVTLTSADARGQYNGAALTAPEVTVSGDGFARGQGADYTVTGEQTMPGSSDNTFTYALRDGTRAENYEITVIYGTLTVTDRAEKYQITVTSKDAKVLYDGTPKEAPALEMPMQVSVDGHEYFVDGLHAGTVGTDAGVYVNEIVGDPVVRDAYGNDVTGQFTISRSEGTLLINARTLILTSASAVRAYDGQPLTAAGVTWEGDGFADGEGIVCEMTGSQTQPGSSANTFTYSFTEGTKAENYHITMTEGTLTVTVSEENLLISSGSGTWVYDGQPHTMPVYQVTYGETVVMGDESGQTFTLPTGDTLTITEPASVTDVADSGMGNNRFSYTLSNRDSYESVTTVFGSLEVTPRNVILTSGSASREYNGTPLTEHKTTVSGDGFVDGEGVHINVTGSQTFVGGEKGNNRFTWEMQDGTRAENYEITPVYGTLIVTQDTHELIIRSDDGSWLYDGLPHTAAGVSVTYGGQRLEGTAGSDGIRFVLPAGDELTVQSQGLAVNTDDSAAHNNTLTWNLSGEDQYANVRVVPGTLIIRPREVVLTSESAEKVYDGEALTAGGISVSGDGFAEGEGILAEVTGSITQPGEQDNVFTYTFRDGTQSENYMIYPVYGTLTVLPAPEPTPTPGPTPAPAPLIPDPDNYRPLAVNAEVLSGKEFYSPGDQVEYEIMVVNFGNVPLTNIVVEDTISGRLEEIEYLSEGDVVFIQGVYTVSMEDVINGSVHNIITVKADDIDDPAVTTRPIPVQTRITVEISIIDLNTELQVSKRILNADPDHPFGLGDTIYYEIVVGNMGNVDYENVKVSDALTGLNEFIDVLHVGETRNYVTEYTVTSDDILAGTLVNHALAAGDPIPRPEGLDIKTPEGVGEIGAELEDIDLTLNVAKEVLTKGVVHEDETVEYAITVSNDGNVPYSNVEVVDELTDFYELIQVLEPGESRTFVTRYVVTRQDVIRGLIYNNAYAVGRKVEEADDTPGGHSEAEKPTGDRLRLRIRYYRDGELMDTYSGTYEYGDAYRVVSPPIPGYVPDKAVVWGTLTEDKTVKVFYTKEKYTLEIFYVFADGRQAAPPYKAVLETGQEYSVASPVLAGYRPSQATVAGQMPSRNTQITVFYTVDSSTRPQPDPWQPGDEPADPVNPTNNTDGTGTGSDPAAVVVVPVAASTVSGQTGNVSLSTVRAAADAVVITDYEVPLGVGSVSLNAGECIE
ncbi:MAG: InlB B-repeat-containing protein [Blautia sp.]|nr:InlB B-repeat-containing protein [Blautia sp.]